MNNPLQIEDCAMPARAPDAAYVIYRLEEAGATLLALPPSGYSTRLRQGGLECLPDPRLAVAGSPGAIRPPVPAASRITRMDEALAWLSLIPKDRYALRRIVGARALVSPVTERHLFSWRRLGSVLGADHKAVQRWHAQAIDIIVAGLKPADAVAARKPRTVDDVIASVKKFNAQRIPFSGQLRDDELLVAEIERLRSLCANQGRDNATTPGRYRIPPESAEL